MAIAANSAMGNIVIGQTKPVDTVASTATGGTSGSSGSSGSSAVNDQVQFYQIYKAIAQVLGIPFNKKIALMAYKNRQPGSGFLALTKKFDPNYLHTSDFKNNAAQYVAKWKEMLPGRKVDYNDMKRYVRGDFSTDRIEQVIMKTKAFKKAYPFFRYGDQNVATYRAYQGHLKNVLAGSTLGPMTKRREEMFFKYDMDPGELDQRVEEFIGGSSALDMMLGNNQKKGGARADEYLFSTPGNIARRAILKQAVETQTGLNRSTQAGSSLQRQEGSGRVIQTGL